MSEPQATTRLLPWTSPEGKFCILVSDGKGEGLVSRVADSFEAVQLGMAGSLLDHATDMIADHKATSDELRFLACQLTEALRDVRRVAESRGARPPAPDRDQERSEGRGAAAGEHPSVG
ncbi:hypothetical protein ACTPOK_27350 [Streptomyces inhibens]|uniref:hypothetical protein n=1 Tax=Streptomyces inhibens TaxID=2293571 RepID=UPI00402AD9F5